MHPFHGHERKTYGAQFISIRPFCCHIAFYILCHSQKAPVDLAARHKLCVLYHEQQRSRRLYRRYDPDDLVRRTYARKDGREQKRANRKKRNNINKKNVRRKKKE